MRAIGRWSLVALVINSIIGSGIFGLPSIVAGLVGTAAPLAYVAAAAGIGFIMACFAEVASRFREAGGPYLYARVAFGRLAGIEIAWLLWLTRVTGVAAIANLFVVYLGEFWPHAKDSVPRVAILTLFLGLLATINYCGVRGGTYWNNYLTVAKLLPLVAFVGAGLFFVRGSRLDPAPSAGAGAWLDAVLVLVFAFGGFEAALIPMGEAKDPRHDAPFACFTALAVVTLLYTLVQVVVTGVLPNPEQTDRPLATAARLFSGSFGAALITAGALVSMSGVSSALTLATPRLTFALAECGDFPAIFGAVHRRFRTPYLSIVVFAGLVWVLAVAGTFRWNVTLSAVARLFTYASTCAALLVLRRRQPGADAFRLPGGPVFALLGIGFSLVLITRMGGGELLILIVTAAIALLNWFWARERSR